MHVVLLPMINCRDLVREMWFRLNNVEIKFSYIKFAIVTDLIFEHDTEVSNYINCVKRPWLKEKYFLSVNRALAYLDIENAVKALEDSYVQRLGSV